MRSVSSRNLPCTTGAQFERPSTVGSSDFASDAKLKCEEAAPQPPLPSGSSKQDIAQELWAHRLELASQRDEIQSLRLQLDAHREELHEQRSFAKELYNIVLARSKEISVGASNLRAALIEDLEQRLQGTLREEIHMAMASFESIRREVVSRAFEREGAILEGALREAISNSIKVHRSALGEQRAETTPVAFESEATGLVPQLGQGGGHFSAAPSESGHRVLSESGHGSPKKAQVAIEFPRRSTAQDTAEGLHTCEESESNGITKCSSTESLASGVIAAIWALPEPRKRTLPEM